MSLLDPAQKIHWQGDACDACVAHAKAPLAPVAVVSFITCLCTCTAFKMVTVEVYVRLAPPRRPSTAAHKLSDARCPDGPAGARQTSTLHLQYQIKLPHCVTRRNQHQSPSHLHRLVSPPGDAHHASSHAAAKCARTCELHRTFKLAIKVSASWSEVLYQRWSVW